MIVTKVPLLLSEQLMEPGVQFTELQIKPTRGHFDKRLELRLLNSRRNPTSVGGGRRHFMIFVEQRISIISSVPGMGVLENPYDTQSRMLIYKVLLEWESRRTHTTRRSFDGLNLVTGGALRSKSLVYLVEIMGGCSGQLCQACPRL